ncbi:hypothetical protein BDQ12DRAFT_721638 [Crucibulum laeve]|uniref:Uncharacterized protein n=1 Tax=Crucibulum laeve TaxID=68775 RepID=A0A5C3MG72_9AGAR|nr:hypothetical protein BDQ12DRAFT_721638 [Crucibulum laeve]
MSISIGGGSTANPELKDTVQKAITYSYSTIRGQLKRKSMQPNRNPAGISKSSVIWLGNHAFHAVIGRKPGNYVKLLKSLQFELSRPRYRRYQKRFSRLVKDGQEALVPIE